MRTSLALIVTALVAAPATGQPSLSVSLGTAASTLSAPDRGSQESLQASADFEHRFLSSKARVFYELATGDHAADGDWRSLANHGGFSYRLADASNRHIYVGVDGGFRRNGAAWSAAGFNGFGAFANIEWHAAPATFRTGYRADFRWFPSLSPMDQSQQTVFASMLLNLQTRTTIIAEANAGTKRYAERTTATVFEAVSAAVPEGHGRGWRLAGSGSATLEPIIIEGAPATTARQITLFGRIAQSLANRTALSVELSRRRVDGEVSPVLVATPPLFMDDGVYDDLFASNLDAGVISLKTILGQGLELLASIEQRRKHYPGTPAFDVDGNVVAGVLRDDEIFRVGVDTAWPLAPTRTGPVALDLLAGYEFTRSNSTSALYRYRAHTLHVGLGISY